MDRQQVLEKAFANIHFDDGDFDIGLVYRLGNSVRSSVENMVGHGLNRVHAWLWPRLSTMVPGEELVLGRISIKAHEDLPAAGREWSKKSFVAHVDGERWKLAWIDIDGSDAHFAVGVDPDGFFSAGYCDFKKGLHGPVSGHVSGKGAEIRKLFDFIGIAAGQMPEEILTVREETVWPGDYDGQVADLVGFEGGLGSGLASDLYEMAEQRACAILAGWAAPRVLALNGFLTENGFVSGHGHLKHNDGGNLIFALDRGDGRVAYVHQSFPGDGEFDTYVSWTELDENGIVTKLNSHALSPGASLDGAALTYGAGDDLPMAFSHDFKTSVTTFGDGSKGYTHLVHFAAYLGYDSHFADQFDLAGEGETFERVSDDPHETGSSFVGLAPR